MAGLALTPKAFARAGIGGGVDLGKGDLDHLLLQLRHIGLFVDDDIPAHVILAVAIHVVKAFRRPSAQKQDQHRAAQRPEGFGDGHRIKHGSSTRVSISRLCRVFPPAEARCRERDETPTPQVET
jgi:hypothetical protein